MSKDNIRSFRYGDEVAQIIENYPGKNFGEKFENLVLFCFYEEPKVQKELDGINASIEKKSNRLQELSGKLQVLERCKSDLDNIMNNINSASQRIIRNLEDL